MKIVRKPLLPVAQKAKSIPTFFLFLSSGRRPFGTILDSLRRCTGSNRTSGYRCPAIYLLMLLLLFHHELLRALQILNLRGCRLCEWHQVHLGWMCSSCLHGVHKEHCVLLSSWIGTCRRVYPSFVVWWLQRRRASFWSPLFILIEVVTLTRCLRFSCLLDPSICYSRWVGNRPGKSCSRRIIWSMFPQDIQRSLESRDGSELTRLKKWARWCLKPQEKKNPYKTIGYDSI